MAFLFNSVANAASGKFFSFFTTVQEEMGVLTKEQWAQLQNIETSYKNHESHLNEAFEKLNLPLDEATRAKFTTILSENGKETELSTLLKSLQDNVGLIGVIKKAGQAFAGTIGSSAKDVANQFLEQLRAQEPDTSVYQELILELSLPRKQSQTQKSFEQLQTEIATQKERLKNNLTSATMGFLILKSCCGLDVSFPQIKNYIDASQHPATFKDLIFQQIDDAANVFFLRKWFSKLCYLILEPVVSLYTTTSLDRSLENIEGNLNNLIGDQATPTLNSYLDLINDHLTTIESAFGRVAQNSSLTRSIETTVLDDVKRAELITDMTPEDLYAKVADVFIHRFMPSLNLRASVYSLFETLTFSDTSCFSCFNYPLQLIVGLSLLIASPLLFSIDWIGSKLISFILYRISQSSEIVKTVCMLHPHASGIQKQYRHAMNQFIVQKLETLWERIHSSEETPEVASEAPKPLSQDTIDKLATMIRTLVLDVGYALHATSPASLKAHYDLQKQPKDTNILKDLFKMAGIPIDVLDAGQNAAGQQLVLLLQSLLNPETISELELAGLHWANNSFTNTVKEPTDEEVIALENQRNALLSKIFQETIRTSVNESLYPKLKIEKEIHQFISQTKYAVQELITQIESNASSSEKTKEIVSKFALERTSLLNSSSNSIRNLLQEKIDAPLAEKLKALLNPSSSSSSSASSNFDGWIQELSKWKDTLEAPTLDSSSTMDFSAFADGLSNFITKQIMEYAQGIPHFMTKEMNRIPFIHRVLAEFIKS